ncbi:MAG: hypothetical protein [Microvirus sp.]|nr:MAG: hypothetical protein [Microvirus sp.]
MDKLNSSEVILEAASTITRRPLYKYLVANALNADSNDLENGRSAACTKQVFTETTASSPSLTKLLQSLYITLTFRTS